MRIADDQLFPMRGLRYRSARPAELPFVLASPTVTQACIREPEGLDDEESPRVREAHIMNRSITIPLFFLTLTSACEPTGDPQTLREQLAVELSSASVPLTDALAIAEAELPGATVLEAELELEHGATVYVVELHLDGFEHEVHVSPEDGSVLRVESSELDAEDATKLMAAAALVLASPGWAVSVAAAETAAGGTAFEVEAKAEKGVLEIEVLADFIWEVEVDVHGNIVELEIDDAWGADDERDDDDDDDDA